MSLNISYESEGFPSSTIPDGRFELPVSWDEILWAAVTVGRPDRYHVFRGRPFTLFVHDGRGGVRPWLYGDYEAMFRWSLIRMAVEKDGPSSSRLQQTQAMKCLDRTEKGMVNYFIGMTFCKLFAHRLLCTPWLLHLDIFREQLQLVLQQGSRPDLVGQSVSNQWHGFECKGRMQSLGSSGKKKAKDQACRLISVKSIPCTLHVGSVTYFRRNTLEFYWCDPPSRESEAGIEIDLPEDAWRHYYGPIAEIIASYRQGDFAVTEEVMERDVDNNLYIRIPESDVEIGVHRVIEELLADQEWERARLAASERAEDFRVQGFHPDGVLVRAGDSWNGRNEQLLGVEPTRD